MFEILEVGSMRANIGSPVASYYQNQSIYMRDFTGGKVV
jgi:hypothetical protein